MKKVLLLLTFFTLQGCLSNQGNKILDEIQSFYQESEIEAITEEEGAYLNGQRRKMKDTYLNTLFRRAPDARSLAMLSRIDSVHAMAGVFYQFADSIRSAFSEKENFPFDALMGRYIQTINKIKKIQPPVDSLELINYETTPTRSYAAITISRMKKDVAQYALKAIESCFMNMSATIFDDFGTPYCKPLICNGSSYAFTVHHRAGQELPNSTLTVDTLMLNGRVVKHDAVIHSKDILCTVSFDSLVQGKYTITGTVKVVTDKIDIRSFVHKFEIH